MTNATINIDDYRKDARHETAFEKLAATLRDNDTNNFSGSSPYAACLMPLLEALGSQNYTLDLVEALPHFAGEFDLVDLRNVLVSLGYESRERKLSLNRVSGELLPCLFVADDGKIFVFFKKDGKQLHYFDAQSNSYEIEDSWRVKGTAYFFTDRHPSYGIGTTHQNPNTWVSELLQRFKGMIRHLLAMTLFINVVALSIPLFIMVIYDKVIGAKSLETLPYLLAGIGIALLFDMGLRWLRAGVLARIAGRMEYLIGVETFDHLLRLPPSFSERSTVPAQLSRLRQFDSIRDFFTGHSASLLLELPFMFLFIGVIALLGGWIAIIPLLMILTYFLIGLFCFPALETKVLKAGKTRTDRQRMLIETFAGRRDLKATAADSAWLKRYRETSGEAITDQYETIKANAVLNGVSQGIVTVAGTAVLGFGALSVTAGDMSVGALIATMALVWRVLSPLQGLFLSYTKFEQTLQTIKQINQLMKLPIERHAGQSALLMPEIEGRILLDRVSYRYGPDQDPALLGLSLEVKPGEMISITGATGSGKSTVLKLIAGMYRPQAGALLLDKTDIRQLNAPELRRAIAYVPQRPRLFRGTVAQNIRLKNMLASDEQVHAAAEKAGVLNSILEMPNGFDTLLGSNIADRLPPGFAQELCMARAYVRDAPIILLDEPAASFDRETDENFMRQLKQLKGKHTIVMVSHRPSHIKIADKAIILDQGVVQFAGDPEKAISLMLESAA